MCVYKNIYDYGKYTKFPSFRFVPKHHFPLKKKLMVPGVIANSRGWDRKNVKWTWNSLLQENKVLKEWWKHIKRSQLKRALTGSIWVLCSDRGAVDLRSQVETAPPNSTTHYYNYKGIITSYIRRSWSSSWLCYIIVHSVSTHNHFQVVAEFPEGEFCMSSITKPFCKKQWIVWKSLGELRQLHW